METERFSRMRRRALREHKQLIVRTARNGHKNKGRGLVLVKFTKGGVHLSYLPVEVLKQRDHGDALIERISGYSPDSLIPVLVTDGITDRFSFGVRQ